MPLSLRRRLGGSTPLSLSAVILALAHGAAASSPLPPTQFCAAARGVAARRALCAVEHRRAERKSCAHRMRRAADRRRPQLGARHRRLGPRHDGRSFLRRRNCRRADLHRAGLQGAGHRERDRRRLVDRDGRLGPAAAGERGADGFPPRHGGRRVCARGRQGLSDGSARTVDPIRDRLAARRPRLRLRGDEPRGLDEHARPGDSRADGHGARNGDRARNAAAPGQIWRSCPSVRRRVSSPARRSTSSAPASGRRRRRTNSTPWPARSPDARTQ